MIKRLVNGSIDKNKWDQAILQADTPKLYALSWFLDIVSPQWQAYVLNDYEAVFPLPLKHKSGLPYLMQPPYCQQLGIFGSGIPEKTAKEFYRRAQREFLFHHLCINGNNGLAGKKHVTTRTNFVLDLSLPYEKLFRCFDENTRRNIKKAEKQVLSFKTTKAEPFLAFYLKNAVGLNEHYRRIIQELVNCLEGNGYGEFAEVIDLKGNTLASALFVHWNKQILYLAGSGSSEGKEASAMFLLFNEIIKKYAESPFVLDFEGSMLPGVARFFKGFGATAATYYVWKGFFLLG